MTDEGEEEVKLATEWLRELVLREQFAFGFSAWSPPPTVATCLFPFPHGSERRPRSGRG